MTEVESAQIWEPDGMQETLALWGLAFPVILLVVLGLAGPKRPQHSLGDVKFLVVYTPVVIMLMLTVLSLSAVPAALASYRDKGYLRRPSTTPVGAVRLLTAQLLIAFALETSAVILILVVARVAFSVPLPGQLGGFLLAIVLAMNAMLGFGVLIAAVAPSQRIAAGIGSLLLFPLMFFAGLWVPQAQTGAALRDVSHYTPLGAAAPAVQNAIAGHWPGSVHLLVLAGYAVVLCALAADSFVRTDERVAGGAPPGGLAEEGTRRTRRSEKWRGIVSLGLIAVGLGRAIRLLITGKRPSAATDT